MKLISVIFTLLTIPLCRASINYKLPETTLVFSCMVTIDRSYQFDYDTEDFWGANCQYAPKVATFTACFKESPIDFAKVLDQFLNICQTFGGFDLTKEELYEIDSNGTRYLLDPTRDEVRGILHEPVIPDHIQIKDYFTLYSSYFDTINRASELGNLLNRYWIFALLTIGLFNWIKTTRLNNFFANAFINQIRSSVTIPTLSKSHLESYNVGICETLLPTKQEFFLIVIYFGICIYGSSTNYVIYLNNALFVDRFSQWTRFIADRTGIISFTQLPLLFLFGGRNNLLIKISGLQYNSFIIFHKWISRLMFTCAFVHGVCYMLYSYHYHLLLHDFTKRFWNFGVIALTACLGLMIQAIYKFRKTCYEWFLLIHIVLLLVFIISCIVHCWNIGWLQYCYYSLGFWCLDRILRVYKIYKFGFTIATIEALSIQDPTLKVSIPKPSNYSTFPGSYVFIHFLSPDLKFWESHPFTIYDHDGNLVIVMKPKKGMTQVLYNRLLKSNNYSFQLQVAIEGPYGHPVSKKNYQQTMLLAGGNGIPGPFYHALSVVGDTDLEEAFSRLKLCWVVRDLESLVWFYKELLLIVDHISIEIYVTREKLPVHTYGSIFEADWSSSTKAYEILRSFPNVKFFNTRPMFSKMLRNEILSQDLKNMSIISCGNPMMCDVIRDSCAELIDEFNGVKIDLYEELQVW